MSPTPFERQLANLAGSAGQASDPAPAGSIRQRARRHTATRAAAAGVLTLVVLGGTGFGVLQQMSHGSAPLGTPSSEPPAGSPSAPAPDPSLSPVPSGSAAAPNGGPSGSAPTRECALGDLRITSHSGDAAAGHRGFVLVFQNTGTKTCYLKGYPGVDALDAGSRLVEHARRTTSGYLGGLSSGGGPPAVSLGPGQLASALVEALAFRASDGSACTAYASLLVTPPDETHSVTVRWDNDGCSDLQVHPVVPGLSGRAS